MKTRSWIDDEPGMRATLGQALLLLRGGARRATVTIAVTLLLVSALVAELALTKHVYAPRLVLRVVEMAGDPLALPRPRHDLREYVREAIWSDDALLDLIARHSLYPSLRRDPRAGLEALRRDIELDVYQNYFAQERSALDPPRSARLVVRYRSVDPDQATAVTRALGGIIVAHELSSRADQAARAAADINAALTRAQREQQALRAEVATKQRGLGARSTPDPKLQVDLVSLFGSLDALDKRTLGLEQREAALALGVAAETQGLGLRFTVIDDGAVSLSGTRGRQRVAAIALAALLLGLPMIAMGVGAFGMKQRGA